MSPDRRKHRGAHGEDRQLFGPNEVENLRQATIDLSWMLERGYAARSALKLVGDRHALRERQRLAISRAAASDGQVEARARTCVDLSKLAGNTILIDGFNLLITIEAGLSGGVLIVGRDRCVRDLSSVHGSYRSVEETEVAIRLVGESLAKLGVGSSTWLLDKPVSNSGRLATGIRNAAQAGGWEWVVELALNPDRVLIASDEIVVSSDSVVLDRVGRWANLGAYIVEEYLPESWVVDFGASNRAS